MGMYEEMEMYDDESPDTRERIINWAVRLRNKVWWVTFIPALLLAVQVFANLLGIQLDLNGFGEKLLACVDAVFALLVILGVNVDPTTKGFVDSKQAMTYLEPKED